MQWHIKSAGVAPLSYILLNLFRNRLMTFRISLGHIPVELLAYIFENLTLAELDVLEQACVHNPVRYTISAFFRRRVVKSSVNPLRELVQIRRPVEIEYLAFQSALETALDVNIKDEFGQTPLHIAAENGCISVLQALFRFPNILVDHRDCAGRSPLVLAAQSGHVKAVGFLLQHGAEVDLPTHRGLTALSYAARNGHSSTASLLIYGHADPLSMDVEGWKALDWAIMQGHNGVVGLLLCHHHHFQGLLGEQNKILLLAAESGNDLAIGKILVAGADVNCSDGQGSTPLHWAVSIGHQSTVQLLLGWGADPNLKDIYGNTPLHWAVAYPHITRLLIGKKVDVDSQNEKGKTCLMFSVLAAQEETSMMLLTSAGADVNIQDENNCTALHGAAATGSEAIVLHLLRNGANVRAMDVDGWMPVHTAAIHGHLTIVNLLGPKTGCHSPTIGCTLRLLQNEHTKYALEDMAQRKSMGSEGVSGLRSAVNSKHTHRLLDLLETGVDIDELDPVGGATALTLASWFNDENTVKLLLENGAAIDATDCNGRTALHVAIEGGYCDLVALLANKGANLEAKYCGWTSLLLAAKRLWDEKAGQWMVEYLSTKVGSVNLNAKDYHGRGIPHWCAVYGRAEIMTNLFRLDPALIDVRDHYDQSVLHYAIGSRNVGVLQVLLKQGVDLASQSCDGLTPAHIAAYTGQLDVLGILVNAYKRNYARRGGVQTSFPLRMELELDTTDVDGYTPLTLALLTGNLHIAQFLRRLPIGGRGDFQYRDGVTYSSIFAWRPPPLHLPAEEEAIELSQCKEGEPPRKPLFDATVRGWLRYQLGLVSSETVCS